MRDTVLIALMTVGLFSPIVPAAAQGRAQSVQLPEGPGHGLNNITNSWGNTREGSRELFGSAAHRLPPFGVGGGVAVIDPLPDILEC